MQKDDRGSIKLDEARALIQSVQDLVVDGPRAALISREGYHRPHTRGGGCELPPARGNRRGSPVETYVGARAGRGGITAALRADANVCDRQPRIAPEGSGRRCRRRLETLAQGSAAPSPVHQGRRGRKGWIRRRDQECSHAQRENLAHGVRASSPVYYKGRCPHGLAVQPWFDSACIPPVAPVQTSGYPRRKRRDEGA